MHILIYQYTQSLHMGLLGHRHTFAAASMLTCGWSSASCQQPIYAVLSCSFLDWTSCSGLAYVQCCLLKRNIVLQFKTLKDSTLAYSFSYPVSTGKDKLPVVLSRRPERYSSAPPLAPDARQRIVSELVDFSHGLVMSMTVCSNISA